MSAQLTPEMIRDAVVGKDRAAIDAVVRALTPIVQANVARVLYSRRAGAQGRVVRQEIEDMTQDVFEVLLADGGRRLLAWDPEVGSLSAFFGLIAQRSVHNILSSRKQSPWTEEPAEQEQFERHLGESSQSAERVVGSRQLLRVLGQRIVKELGERDVRLFELLYVRNADDDEVRAELGLGRDALYQARRRLMLRTQQLAADLVAEQAS